MFLLVYFYRKRNTELIVRCICIEVIFEARCIERSTEFLPKMVLHYAEILPTILLFLGSILDIVQTVCF